MHKRSVRRIHESDDAVVHAAWQVRGQVRDLVFPIERRDARRRKRRLDCFRKTGTWRRRFGYENPNVAVVLLAGITPGVDPIHFQFLIGSQRRNELALAGVSIELPAVVAALQILSVKPPARERHTAVRTGIAQGKRLSLAITAD